MTEILINFLKVNRSAADLDAALLILRVGIGLLMLNHGLPKMKKLLSSEPVHFFKIFGINERISMILAAFTEVVFSGLVIVGLGTSWAVIPLLFTMVVAAFFTLRSQPFDKKELPVLYLLIYLTLMLSGGGKYSLDFWLFS